MPSTKNITPNAPLYFAYGSNLDVRDLEQRSPALVSLLEPVGPAYLPDRALAFTRKSAARNGGVLDVVPHRGAIVHGMLFRVLGNGWDLLDRKEGARGDSPAYRRISTVALVGHAEVPVQTYVVAAPGGHVAPGPDYLEVVRRGCERWDLDVGGLERAAQGQRAAPLSALFAYGTLMRGESRFARLQPEQLTCALLAESGGTLYDHGAFPGFRPGETDRLVQGEYVIHRDIEALLARLDEIEGFRGWGASSSLFRRAVIDVGMCDGRVRQAWTYVTCIDGAPPIPSGDWRAHRGTRADFLDHLVAGHCGPNERDLARRFASRRGMLDAADVEPAAAALLPLSGALARGILSERQLAQLSERWVVTPAWVAG